jgi:hypothetical protein
LDALGDLVTARAFALGLLWGGLAVLLSPFPARLTRRTTADMGGLAFAFAGYIGVRAWGGTGAAPLSIACALALLAIGGNTVDHVELRLSAELPRAAVAPLVALAPGALALAVAVPVRHPLWVPFVVFVSTVIVGGLLHDFDRAHGASVAPFLLLLISVVGAYLTVPDTRMLVVLCGVAVPLALLSFPQPLAGLGPAGSAAIAGLFCWVVTVSARTDEAAVVGGLATLGLLIAEPVGRRFRKAFTTNAAKTLTRGMRRRSHTRRSADRWTIVVLTAAVCQIGLILYAARVVGVEDTAAMATLALAPAAVATAFVVADIVPTNEPRTRSHSYGHARTRRRAAW